MTETTREVVDEWALANGDRLMVIRSTIKKVDANGVRWSRSFFFHVVAPNGEKVGTSGESFTRKRTAVRAAERHYPRVDVPE